MHMAKRHRISHRLSTSDTILFVIDYEEGGAGTPDLMHNFKYRVRMRQQGHLPIS
jgi:hypothetical protein